MSCNVPTDIAFSFHGLSQRGGGTGKHDDGWGLCLYDGPAVHIFREAQACASSPLARFVRDNPLKTKLAVAHIRKTTRGSNTLKNTHPFTRELWGRTWAFAHNGTIRVDKRVRLRRYQPIGSTDSEWAFCFLLERLLAHGPAGDTGRALKRAADQLGDRGSFNFLLGDGKTLYARCHTKLCYLVRKHPFTTATLHDADVTIDFREHTRPRDRVAVIATLPLTKNEAWTQMQPGELYAFANGRLL